MTRVSDAVAAILIALVAGSALCQNEGTKHLSNENQENQKNQKDIMERLRSNIMLYNKVYFDWNRRHLFGDTSSLWEIEGKKDEVSRQLLKQLREGDRVAAGLKMKIDDIPKNDDLSTDIVSENKDDKETDAAMKRVHLDGHHNNEFESVSINDRKTREAAKVGQKTHSTGLDNDEEFADLERRGPSGPRPLRMILTETIDDETEHANEEEREEARRIGPMKVAEFGDLEERGTGWPGPKPLRMILTETIDDDIEKAIKEEREGARRIGPMKVAEIGDFKERGTGWPGPRPLRMILTETIDDEIEHENDEERQTIERTGPLRMIIADGTPNVDEFTDFKRKKGTGRPGPKPLRMVVDDNTGNGIEQANQEEKEIPHRIGPLRMIIADGTSNDKEFAEFEIRGPSGPRPLRMILNDNFENDIENADVEGRKAPTRIGPLRMIIADGTSNDEEYAEFEIRGPSGPRPLRMILNDNFENDIDNADIEERNTPNRIGPLRMIIADGTHDDAELTEMKRYESGYPGPRPLRMFVSDIIAENGEDADLNIRKAKGKIGPMKSIPPANEYYNEDMKLRKAAGPIGPMKMVPSLDEYYNNAELTDLDSDLQRRLVRRKRDTKGRLPSEYSIDDRKIVREKKGTFSMNFGGDQKQNREDPRFYWSNHDKEQCAKEAALIYEWLEACLALVKDIPDSYIDLFENWGNIIQLFNNDTELRLKFAALFPAMNVRDAIEIMSIHEAFQKLFWPFRYKIGFLNQKLGLLGFSGKEVSMEEQKLAFYEALEKYQSIKIITAADSVTYSFNDSAIVDGLNRSGLVEFSKEFIEAGRHLTAEDERPEMILKVSEAMKLVEERTPELYRAINQLVGTFAFYKAELPGYIGGTVSSALGIIWLDPGAMRNLSIPFFAEQIVHEYIHTALFYAELVHGTYTDHANLPNAKVVSSIRRQLRDYDKSFHAAYVSTGLVAFHARAGFLNRAENLAKPLLTTVDDLIVVNNRTGILNESGLSMLQALVDFLTATRLKK